MEKSCPLLHVEDKLRVLPTLPVMLLYDISGENWAYIELH